MIAGDDIAIFVDQRGFAPLIIKREGLALAHLQMNNARQAPHHGYIMHPWQFFDARLHGVQIDPQNRHAGVNLRDCQQVFALGAATPFNGNVGDVQGRLWRSRQRNRRANNPPSDGSVRR